MKTFDKNFRHIFLLFLLLVIIIMFFPMLFTQTSWLDLDFNNTGQIGDTIGGIMGPFIAIGAAILTFLAFWVQYKANEQQKRDLQIERFENKFYELLRLHKENVQEMNIANRIHGRKCFVSMFYELRTCYKTIQNEYDNLINNNEAEPLEIMNFTYKVFFYGIGYYSEKQYFNELNEFEKKLFAKCKKALNTIQNEYRKKSKEVVVFRKKELLWNYSEEIEIDYLPFDGHVNRLGHYYRHIFQMANFIIEQDDNIIDKVQKYNYIKTLRAQLSNFEQLMLYYNAVSWFERQWYTLFTEFRLIKNLPLPLADFYKTPEEKYQKEINNLKERGISMFELLEKDL